MKKDKRNKEVEIENVEEETVEKTEDKKAKKVFKFKKDKTVVPTKAGAERFIIKNKISLNKKQVAGICGGVVAIIVVIVALVLLLGRDNSEKVMNDKLNELGVSFYETFYYKSAGQGDDAARKQFLGKFKDIGIKVSLENLVRYYVTTDDYKNLEGALVDASVTERVDAMINSMFKTDKYECDKDKTRVKIYPTEPYGNKDYKIEIETSCGFESEITEEK